VVAKIDVTDMLRPGLLAGVSLLVARAAQDAVGQDGGLAATVAATCSGLGASVYECDLPVTGELEDDDAAVGAAVAEALAELGELNLLLVDAASALAAAQAPGTSVAGPPRQATDATALVRAMEASWRVTQAVANAAFIERGAAGRVVYLAPPPDAGAHADAARAGLENLARTLSIEWARYGVMPLAIAVGTATSAAEIAALTGYLASPAGDYFSGCLLDLSGPGDGRVPAPVR
jgi:NAD(P)-dependent dehydrogenase (short-subunit alcohol dehydrogenase family)